MPAVIPSGDKNSGSKPLDQLLIDVEEDGITLKIPALDRRWAKRTVFSNYVGLVVSGGKIRTGADLEEWVHESEWFLKDMEFLLQCKHYEFWSYMVYQKSAHAAVVSFLQRANPFYIDIKLQTKDEHVIGLYESILNCVIRLVFRLITNKESPSAWITDDHLRNLLYSNFLISIPMLLDLIIAVGNSNEQNLKILSKVFETTFMLQPKYTQDLLGALTFFRTAFRTIQTQSENEGFDGAGGGAVDENLETPYDDVVLFTLDCAFTLSILFEVCPGVHNLCNDIQLGQSIAQFYDNTIPFLYKNIYLVNESAQSLDWLNVSRVEFLKAFRSITNSHLMAVITNPDESLMPSENFVGLLTVCLSERTFVIDYQREYPVELDMEILKQACKDLDNFKADFVTKGYQQEADSQSASLVQRIAETTEKKSNSKTKKNQNKDEIHSEVPHTTKPNAQRDIDAEVTAALDILPHLGTGFLRRVLLRYENSEDAIAAILEENLPPDLVNSDQLEVYIPSDPQDTLYLQTGVKRFNIYDGDEYDIMAQDLPKCIIKQGKGFPNAPKDAAELLDDKRDIQKLKDRYQEYSLVVDEISENDEYDDEYDDSYEALLESETRVAKSKQLKAGLANVEDVSEEDSEDDEEDKTDNDDSGRREKKLDFCENPEIIRARYEAKRAAKMARGRKGSGAEPPTSKSYDVVGAPKGQGQDKDTLKNRNKKEIHKSSRANHNRKAGAAFKRSKGMIA